MCTESDHIAWENFLKRGKFCCWMKHSFMLGEFVRFYGSKMKARQTVLRELSLGEMI